MMIEDEDENKILKIMDRVCAISKNLFCYEIQGLKLFAKSTKRKLQL